jgi:glycosyltransferase involved in cell wall biosynthesis
VFGIYFLMLKFLGETQTGWTSLITSIWLIGGLQLIAIGLIGEYVGKIYKESKHRPKFIVDIDTFSLPIQRHQLIEDEEFYKMGHRKMSETN